MSTKRNLSTVVSFSPEFVRRGATGLELVQRTGNSETITPVKTTTKGSTRRRRKGGGVITFWVRSVMVGIFPYWIGLSYRNPKPYRTVDLGYIKFMWKAR